MKILVEKYSYYSKKDSNVDTPYETCIMEDTKENRQKIVNDIPINYKIIGEEDFISAKTNRVDYEYKCSDYVCYGATLSDCGHILVLTYEQKEKQLKQEIKKELARLKRCLK